MPIVEVMERAVAIRLNDYLAANDALPRFQSAYRDVASFVRLPDICGSETCNIL